MLVKHPKLDEWKDSKKLDNLLKTIFKQKVPANKDTPFRGSNLPYCPLYHLAERNKSKETDFNANFYFSVGHALHELIQTFALSVEDNLIGSFRCSRMLESKHMGSYIKTKQCAVTYKMTTLGHVKKESCPHKLSECKSDPQFQYQEIDIEYKGLIGHVDLLFRIKDKYFLVDIKTTSNYLFTDRGLASGYYPNGKYWHQIETYAALLEKLYDIKIDQYAILYIGREKPAGKRNETHRWFVKAYTDENHEQREKILRSQTRHFRLANKYLKTGKGLKTIYADRPCQSKKEHDSYMAYRFFEKKCPYWADKSCPSGKILKQIKENSNA